MQNDINEHQELVEKLKNLEIRLKESEKSRFDFLSNIRNQLNNPLSSIIILSEHLIDKLTDTEESRIAKLIHSESLNLDFVLKNLIASGEFSAGEANLEISTFHIKDLINEALRTFSNKTNEKQLKVNLICPESLKITTDRFKLSLALHNLISNAIVFNKYKGSILITIESNKNFLDIAVTDEGSGFSEEEASLIFIPFKQLSSGSNRIYISTGIGLSLVKNITEILEGKINFKSDIGKGSTFTLSVPNNKINLSKHNTGKNELEVILNQSFKDEPANA